MKLCVNEWKLFLLDRNPRYQITVCKKPLRDNYASNVKINVQGTQFPEMKL